MLQHNKHKAEQFKVMAMLIFGHANDIEFISDKDYPVIKWTSDDSAAYFKVNYRRMLRRVTHFDNI